MTVRTTVDIPQPLHDRLRARAERSGTSIRALIIGALEQTYGDEARGELLQGPPIDRQGKLGPQFPRDENPHDLVFS